MQVTNPYTEATSEVTEATDLEGLYQRAGAGAVKWQSVSVVERVTRLRRGYDEFSARSDEFASLVADEMGKPIRFSRVELERAIDEWRYLLDNAVSYCVSSAHVILKGFTPSLRHGVNSNQKGKIRASKCKEAILRTLTAALPLPKVTQKVADQRNRLK